MYYTVYELEQTRDTSWGHHGVLSQKLGELAGKRERSVNLSLEWMLYFFHVGI